MMFDDDDDGVEPQFKVVDEYHFEDGNDEPVCFSILPFQFDENDGVAECDFEKNVYLRGVADKSLYQVHRKVVAWRVGLDCEQPDILVLSSEGNWISLLRPEKCYREVARSILITVQMLHFIRKQPGDKRRIWGLLWDHLHDVFDKFDAEPVVDDLRKHHPLIKLFVERDPTLMNSKILEKIIEVTTGKKQKGCKVQLISSDEPQASSNDEDDDHGNEDNNNGGDCSNNEHGDCSNNEHDSDNDYSYREDSIKDNYSSGEDDSDGDNNVDCDTDNNDGTDMICAICDDGGKLLSCVGQCKRSFHPRLKDGRESNCKTLGYTSAQLKGISTYLCKNCEYQQHQCFKCGELEPSDEPNAKVFKCNNASCGHFYHPMCVAKLLEPDDGACELAKRIVAGMSFTCPVHWCSECGKMEDRNQRALQFAVCRRCPKSYHRECLPRKISFVTKGKIKRRAWELSKIILIYCGDHNIYKATGTAGRNHIRFPSIPKISKTRDLAKKKIKMTGKTRRSRTAGRSHKEVPHTSEISKTRDLPKKKVKMITKRKRSVDQCSTKSAEMLKRLCGVENERIKRVAVDSLSEHMVLRSECAAKSLKEDLQLEQFRVEAATPNRLEAVQRKEKQFGTSSSLVIETTIPTSILCSRTEKRVTSKEDKETPSGTSHDIATKRVMPSTKGMFDCCVQVADKLHSHMQPVDMQAILLENPLADKDAEQDRITKDKDGSERDKASEHYSGKERDAPNKDTSHENHEQNDVLDNLSVDECAEGDRRISESRKERGMECRENAYGHDSMSGQEKEISRMKNQMCRRTCEQDPRSDNGKIARNDSDKTGMGDGGMTSDQAGDYPPEKQVRVASVDKMSITSRVDVLQEFGCNEDREVNGRCLKEPNSSQCNDNLKAIDKETLDNKARKDSEPKEKASDGKKVGLDKDSKHNHIVDEREGRHEDGRTIHPQAHGSHQFLANNKEPHVRDSRSGDSGLKSPQCNDERRAAGTCEDKSKERTGSNRSEESMHNMRENPCNSPVERNAQNRPRSHSPECQRVNYHGSYPGTKEEHLYKHHPRTNDQHSYEQQHYVNYSRNYYFDRRCNDYFDRRQPEFIPAYFDAGRWHNPPSFLRGPEHDITGWCSPPFHPRGPGYFTRGWHSSPFNPRRPQHAEYPRNGNNMPPNLRYDAYGNFNHGGYHAMGIDPATRYPPQVNNIGAAYGRHRSEYGVRSNYTFGWGPQAPAAGLVMDRYAPCLEQTNNQPRG